ncbi:MAG: hypothetical protein AAGC96_08845 [Pseudomonadota bacterium]
MKDFVSSVLSYALAFSHIAALATPVLAVARPLTPVAFPPLVDHRERALTDIHKLLRPPIS